MNRKRIIGLVGTVLVAIAYGISPVDVIPDAMLPVGLGDDAAVLIAAAVVVMRLVAGAKRPKPQVDPPTDAS